MVDEFLHAYDRFSDAIFRHCHFRIGDRERAKELMQETFCRAWEYSAKGNKVENIRAFLYRIANNLIVDETRRKPAVSLDEIMEKGFEPSSEEVNLADIIDGRELLAALDSLDEQSRTVVVMRYIDDWTPKEIAQSLNENVNVISVRLHRAVEKIKKLLRHYE